MKSRMLATAAWLCIGTSVVAQSQSGIMGRKAPPWDIKTWSQLPKGKKTIDVDAFKGKVLYLYCFQSWCPGCHAHGFPTLQKLVKHYQRDSDVKFVAVQTVFEGFGSNTPARGRACVDKYKLKIPFGHSGARDEPSKLMRRYRTAGTPWTIVIDRKGVVRYNQFHIRAEDAVRLIDALKKEEPAPADDPPDSP